MLRRLLIGSIVIAFLLTAHGAPAYIAGPVGHFREGVPIVDSGYFDLAGTEFDGTFAACQGTAPPARIWPLGHFSQGWPQRPNELCHEWLLNGLNDLGLPDASGSEWLMVDGDLEEAYGPGRYLTESSDVAAETSFWDSTREGTADHRSYYAVATVQGCGVFELGTIVDGLGPNGNVMPMAEPPVPTITALAQAAGWAEIQVDLQDPAPGYTDGLAQNAVIGQRLLYIRMESGEPTSSDPAFYEGEVFDGTTGDPYGVIPLGTSTVSVAVPREGIQEADLYVVAQVAYDSPTALAYSAGVSRHGLPVHITGYPGGPDPDPPVLNIVKAVTPTNPNPGDPVSYIIIVENEGEGAATDALVTDNLDLGPDCLDLASVTGLACERCDTIDYAPSTGSLTATKANLHGSYAPGVNTMIITFSATVIDPPSLCQNTAVASADNHLPVEASTAFGGGVIDFLRRNVVTAQDPRTIRQAFPLPPYVSPAPALPWRDDPGVLTSTLHKLVLYQYDAASTIYVLPDRAPDVMSIVVCTEGTCP